MIHIKRHLLKSLKRDNITWFCNKFEIFWYRAPLYQKKAVSSFFNFYTI